jgi:hypothetical protein
MACHSFCEPRVRSVFDGPLEADLVALGIDDDGVAGVEEGVVRFLADRMTCGPHSLAEPVNVVAGGDQQAHSDGVCQTLPCQAAALTAAVRACSSLHMRRMTRLARWRL